MGVVVSTVQQKLTQLKQKSLAWTLHHSSAFSNSLLEVIAMFP